MPKQNEGAASSTRHPYCLDCGTVRNLAFPRARPLEYYLGSLSQLKEYLERSAIYPKLAQVQSHLIAVKLALRPEFEDPYGTHGQAQLDAYISTVQSVRPDLDEELIQRTLKSAQRRRPRQAPELLPTHPGH